jgi:hypothetical protein
MSGGIVAKSAILSGCGEIPIEKPYNSTIFQRFPISVSEAIDESDL